MALIMQRKQLPWTCTLLVVMLSLLLLVLGGECTTGSEGVRRALLQPSPSSPVLPTNVAAPSGSVLREYRGIGTQNYTGQSDTTYKNTGAMADLYSDTKTKGARHFFDAAGDATWIIVNPSTGAQEGLVHGRPVASAPTPSQSNDGGFGSVNALLLQAFGGEGVLASCTYIQRLNVLGGDAPKGFFTLPASNGIPNFEAAFPYQADYIFLGGGPPSPSAGG